MHRIDTPTATPDSQFTLGDPVIPIPPTEVSAEWLNMVQAELAGVLAAAGIAPDKADNEQVAKAIAALIHAGKVDISGLVQQTRTISTTAPLSGGGSLDSDLTLGITPGEEGYVLVSRGNKLVWEPQTPFYEICRVVYKSIHPTPQPGMVPVNGTLVTSAATLHPMAFAYLQTAEGQMMCTTESAWQAANKAFWATLADGTKVGWDGIGGICKYVIDTNAGTIRVPDLRGMYEEVFGFDTLGVGGVHGDAVRRITGSFGQGYGSGSGYGPFRSVYDWTHATNGSTAMNFFSFTFDTALATAVAAKNQPRAWGSLACVYLGLPVS